MPAHVLAAADLVDQFREGDHLEVPSKERAESIEFLDGASDWVRRVAVIDSVKEHDDGLAAKAEAVEPREKREKSERRFQATDHVIPLGRHLHGLRVRDFDRRCLQR
jgi:hypothetical protein